MLSYSSILSNPSPEFLSYIVSKLVEDIRHGNCPEDPVFDSYVRFPLVSEINKIIAPDDQEWVLAMLNDFANPIRQLFAISASRGIHKDPPIRQALMKMWRNSDDFRVRGHLCMHLLDYDDTPNELREQIYEFLTNNLDEWLDFRLVFASAGTGGGIFDVAKSRFQYFHPSKHFIYLYFALLASDRDEGINFLEKYVNSDDALTQKVANDCLARFKNDCDQ